MHRFSLHLLAFLAVAAGAVAKPTVWIIGDSTVRNGSSGQLGWGDPLVRQFDPAKVDVVNRAIGGRSSRTFLTEGRWDAILPQLKAGDFVLMQFGHNDGGELFEGDRPRASIKGAGNEFKKGVVAATGKSETVYSYGWYLRKYATDAISKGASPIIISLIPRNIWKDEKIARADKDYALWAGEAAKQTGAGFIDFNSILADAYQSMGPEKTAALFAAPDHTHTNPDGAAFNAATLAAAIRSLPGCNLGKALLPDELWLPSIFSDHMVLQQEMPIPVWGRAKANSEVTASLCGNSVSTHADAGGKWQLELPPLKAGGPFALEVTSTVTRSYPDVLVGEVWLCSGQSNMDFTLAKTAKRSFSGATDWQQEVAAANHPQLRMFTAGWAMNEFPQCDVPGQWAVCSPTTAGDFSAVAYYFGRGLQENLKVPVGLVTCAYGASTVESWISKKTLAAHPQFKELLKNFENKCLIFRDDSKSHLDYGVALAKSKGGKAPKNPDPFQDQHNPFVLYNGMIAPIIPYAIRGAIWYQGESNLNTTDLYPELQKALIEDWRSLWNNPKLPFYFVQLAAYKSPSKDAAPGGQIARMREAQAKSLSIPHTGMAVTIDIGDAKDVHPRNKLDVGKRLARIALTDTYGHPGEGCGPTFRDASVVGKEIIIHFDHIDGGLVAKGGPLQQFAIAGSDRKFVHAVAVTDGESVTVSSPSVPHPAFVRYAWADNPEGANLCSDGGLPAAPFRKDP